MISTLAFVCLVIGVVCLVLGYTVEPRAIRPGWACIVLFVVLIVLSYVLPLATLHTASSLLTLR